MVGIVGDAVIVGHNDVVDVRKKEGVISVVRVREDRLAVVVVVGKKETSVVAIL